MNHLSRAVLASIVNTTSNLTLRSALSKAWPSHAGAGRATVAWIVGTAQRKVSRKNSEGWYLNAWNRQELQSLDRDWRKRQIAKLRQSQHREKQLEFSRYFGRTSRPSSGDFKEITGKITSPESQTEWLHWFSRINQVSFDTVSFQTSSFPKSVTTVIEFLQPKWTAWNLLTSSSGEKKKLPIFNMRGYMRTPDYRMPWSSFYRLSYHMK